MFAVIASLALLGCLIYRFLRIGCRPANLPPGPPTQPIWGNLKQCDLFFPQYQYTKWAKQYGPVYSVMQGSRPQVIVNRLEDARDIFIKQGASAQNRPPFRFKLLMRNGYFPSMNNGPKWQIARKMWHAVLSPSASKKYIPYQELETEQLLLDVLNEPTSWRSHLDRFTNSIGNTMVNGYRVTTPDDPIIKETVEDLYDMSRLGFRGNLLELWPFLWRLPISLLPIYREARAVAEKHEKYILRQFRAVRRNVEQGSSLPSFNRTIQEKMQEGWTDVTETEGAEIGQHLLSGGTDTVVSTILTCIAAMCLYPEAQRQAQEEIDRVVGSEGLPRDVDIVNLPYTQQFLLEAQRWITAVPLCIPRRTTGPVRWKQYEFPEDTGLILNTYAIHNDPEVFPEPHIFRPERWEGKLDAAQAGAQSLFTFGAGRRHCPGQSLAERGIFLAVSRWLWAFNTSPGIDEQGKEIPIDINNIRPGTINRLNPFHANIQPRSAGHAKLIRSLWKKNCDILLDDNYQWKTSPDMKGKQ